MFNFEENARTGKEAMDAMLKSYASMTRGFQAIATETADYSKKSIEESVSYFDRLTKTKSIEAAFELQTGFVKSAYEGYVSQATKIGELVADLAKDVYKPYEAPLAKATATAKAAVAA